MNDYFKQLQQRINKYRQVYKKNYNKPALKLIWWNIRWLLQKKQRKSLDTQTINIGIKLQGGVGDILIQSNYFKELVRYLNQENITVDFFAFKDKETASATFYNAKFIKNIFPGTSFKDKVNGYDLVLSIQRFAMITYIDWEKIRKLSAKLASYCERIQDFYEKNSFIIDNSPYSDALSTRLAELNGKNRYNQPDILGIVGLEKSPSGFMDLNPDYMSIISKLDLQDKIYITFQRGLNHHDAEKESVRNWPVAHYEQLIKSIKQQYPDIILIQMGFSESRCEKLAGVDMDLRGKTNFEELKVLLKYALLHIDYEGGYTHIRYFLNGPSVVLFGPTDLEFLGYPENININNYDACPLPCEWVSTNWTTECIRGFTQPPCMYEIKSEQVFHQVDSYIKNLDYFTYSLEKALDESELASFVTTINTDTSTALVNETLKIYFEENKISCDRMKFFGLNETQNPDIEYSGIYNIATTNNLFDIVFAQLDKDMQYPGYALSDILRILKPEGILVLKCHSYSNEELAPCKLDFSALPETHYFVIKKNTKK